MRATDEKILEELDMIYDDKDCFVSLDSWLGNPETYLTNINRLFLVADHTKQQHSSKANAITGYCKQILNLFNQTKQYAREWNSESPEPSPTSAENYIKASEESWDTLDQWTTSQEKLRAEIIKLVDFLYSVDSEP
ncbi:MAG: hypothetical protein ACOWW1_08020 [archaeon]